MFQYYRTILLYDMYNMKKVIFGHLYWTWTQVRQHAKAKQMKDAGLFCLFEQPVAYFMKALSVAINLLLSMFWMIGCSPQFGNIGTFSTNSSLGEAFMKSEWKLMLMQSYIYLFDSFSRTHYTFYNFTFHWDKG